MISIDRPKCSLVAFRSLRVGFVVGDDFVVRDLRFSARSREFPDRFSTSVDGDCALALLSFLGFVFGSELESMSPLKSLMPGCARS
jgi:hypothetical protein